MACSHSVSHPEHTHGPGCGHTAIKHGDHIDYVHDGHLHCPHEDHYDEHVIEVSDTNLTVATQSNAIVAMFTVRVVVMSVYLMGITSIILSMVDCTMCMTVIAMTMVRWRL